jgi:hypothetical protein
MIERNARRQIGEHEYGDDEPRERAVGTVDEVDAEGRSARDDDLRVLEAGLRDVVVANAVDEVHRRVDAGVVAPRDADLQDALVAIDEVRPLGGDEPGPVVR